MDRKTMLTRLRDAIGGAADKLSLRLPNGWTGTVRYSSVQFGTVRYKIAG